jgi:diacylglycerol kinase (ATP)
MTRMTLVVNPTKAKPEEIEALHRSAIEACAEAGWPPPGLELTSEHDAGAGPAERARAAGADLIVACGGDGTVNAVAQALADTGAALGIIPLGTGNLLAGSLGVPSGADAALSVLITGVDRRIDLGRTGDRVLVGMAGLGLDAAMIADVPDKLKKRIGWSAYAVSVARHLADRGITVTFGLDGRRVRHHGVRTVLIGNFGQIQGGIDLLPDAAPDDGLLDVVVLAPRGRLLGWVRILLHLRGSGTSAPDTVTRYQARHVIAVTRHPVAQEVDGEFLGNGTRLDIAARHLALTVRLPRVPASPALARSAEVGGEVDQGGAR